MKKECFQNTAHVLSFLKNINTMSPVSASVVMEFQEKIWSGSILDTSDDIAEFLFDLAYELDYYEPDPTSRKEINSLFGEDELHRRVKEAIEKLSIFLSYA